jgi:hypothetical protein
MGINVSGEHLQDTLLLLKNWDSISGEKTNSSVLHITYPVGSGALPPVVK